MGGATTRAKKRSRRCGRDRACDNSDDASWDRRHQHRRAGLNSVYKSKDAVAMGVLIAIGELSPADAPSPPDPYDRSLSKRQWEWGMAGDKQTSSIVEGLSVYLLLTLSPFFLLPHGYAGLA